MTNITLNEIALKDAEYTVLDTETTGTSAAFARIIEIGMVKIKAGKITDTYQSFINPGVIIPSHITAITGIKTADVEDAPPFEEICTEVKEFIGDTILVAHNMQFDISFMRREFERAFFEFPEYQTLCTLKLARKLYPELKSKSLGAMVHHLNIRHKDVHRALGDAMATAKMLIAFFERLEENHGVTTSADMIEFQGRITANSKNFSVKKTMEDSFNKLPDQPGVYFYKNKKGSIVYIGKAKSLVKRVKNYFSTSAQSKPKKIVRQSQELGFIKTNTEVTALIAEAELIKKHNPPLNSQLKRYSQSNFIKITLDKEYPVLKSTAIFDFDGNDYFGPFTNRECSQNLIEAANKSFKLRECKEKEFSRKRNCYLLDLNRCVAPCINQSTNEYKEELGKVYEFLTGNNQTAVNNLLSRMKFYSDNQQYEEAANIRNTVNTLLDQINRSSIIAEPINKANVIFKIRGIPKPDYILMLEGKVYVRDYIVEDEKCFSTALNDYYSGSIHLFNGVDKKDLEKIKILLSWFAKNRQAIKTYYLKDFETEKDLAKAMGW